MLYAAHKKQKKRRSKKTWRTKNYQHYWIFAHHLIRFVYMHAFIKYYCSFLCASLNVGKRQVHFHSTLRFSSFVLLLSLSLSRRLSHQHPNSSNFSAVDGFVVVVTVSLKIDGGRERNKKKNTTYTIWYERSRILQAADLILFFTFFSSIFYERGNFSSFLN